jgi:hypothetical protein
MAIVGRLTPPAGQPVLLGDDRQTTVAWLSFFQDVADQAALVGALPGSPSYANDAAAEAGGVSVGKLYRNGSVLMIRVS